MKNKVEFPKPEALNNETKEIRMKGGCFCKFHMDYNHNTDNCRELSRFIEDQIRAGKFKEFVEVVQTKAKGKARANKGKGKRLPSLVESNESEKKARQRIEVIFGSG